MKKFKRNAVVLTVLLFVCMAVYLNWAYDKNTEKAETIGAASADTADASTEDGGLYYVAAASYDEEYFAQARLNRQEARDAAATTLATVTETDSASQDMVDAALAEISELTDVALREAELESLIVAKGFDDCVVYISDAGVNVTVPAPVEGLSTASVARITDIITSETDFTADQLKVIEIK